MTESIDASNSRMAEWQRKFFRNLKVISEEPSPAYSTKDFFLTLKQVEQISSGQTGWMGFVYATEGKERRDHTDLYKERNPALEEGSKLTDQWQGYMDP